MDCLRSCSAPAAGVALIETGSGAKSDLEDTPDRLLPDDDICRHRHGGRGHGRATCCRSSCHRRPVPVLGSRPRFGAWQSVVLVNANADNPDWKVRLSFIPE
jgi:thiamine phosphate synthase YjbQ (UPF0047 family)